MTITANVESAQVPWRPLGELFVSRGLISEAELETALAEQAATGKRLGEILVDRGLVSGPDLTAALMDQLGVELAKEEGFGSGLWAEIKRRHKRVQPDADENEDVPIAPADGPSPDARVIALVPPEPAPVLARMDPELEQDLEELRTEYQAPAPVEPLVAASTEPVPEPEPAAAPEPDDSTALRAELDEARADLVHLHEMLADAMTALTALTAEAEAQPHEG